MNEKTAIYHLTQLTENYVFINTENNESKSFFLFNPAGNTWQENLIIDDLSTFTVNSLNELVYFNKNQNFSDEIKDFKSIKFILFFWNEIFNRGIYLSTDNLSYQSIISPTQKIKILTKKASEEYIKQRNDASKILIKKGIL